MPRFYIEESANGGGGDVREKDLVTPDVSAGKVTVEICLVDPTTLRRLRLIGNRRDEARSLLR